MMESAQVDESGGKSDAYKAELMKIEGNSSAQPISNGPAVVQSSLVEQSIDNNGALDCPTQVKVKPEECADTFKAEPPEVDGLSTNDIKGVHLAANQPSSEPSEPQENGRRVRRKTQRSAFLQCTR